MQQRPGWATWHSAQDRELRTQIIKNVHNIFAMRKPELLLGSGDPNKLPDFIRRLEEALYKSAPSREEYGDPSTLEARLQDVVRRVMSKPGAARRPGPGPQAEGDPAAPGAAAVQPQRALHALSQPDACAGRGMAPQPPGQPGTVPAPTVNGGMHQNGFVPSPSSSLQQQQQLNGGAMQSQPAAIYGGAPPPSGGYGYGQLPAGATDYSGGRMMIPNGGPALATAPMPMAHQAPPPPGMVPNFALGGGSSGADASTTAWGSAGMGSVMLRDPGSGMMSGQHSSSVMSNGAPVLLRGGGGGGGSSAMIGAPGPMPGGMPYGGMPGGYQGVYYGMPGPGTSAVPGAAMPPAPGMMPTSAAAMPAPLTAGSQQQQQDVGMHTGTPGLMVPSGPTPPPQQQQYGGPMASTAPTSGPSAPAQAPPFALSGSTPGAYLGSGMLGMPPSGAPGMPDTHQYLTSHGLRNSSGGGSGGPPPPPPGPMGVPVAAGMVGLRPASRSPYLIGGDAANGAVVPGGTGAYAMGGMVPTTATPSSGAGGGGFMDSATAQQQAVLGTTSAPQAAAGGGLPGGMVPVGPDPSMGPGMVPTPPADPGQDQTPFSSASANTRQGSTPAVQVPLQQQQRRPSGGMGMGAPGTTPPIPGGSDGSDSGGAGPMPLPFSDPGPLSMALDATAIGVGGVGDTAPLPAASAGPPGSAQDSGLPGLGVGVGEGLLPGGSTPGSGTPMDVRKQQILKQQRWLLFLRHCAKCQVPENECQYGASCTVAKALWHHLIHCKDARCPYPRCLPSRELLKHHQKCSSPECPVCAPVKQYVSRQRALDFQRRTARMTPDQRTALIRQMRAEADARRSGAAGGGAAPAAIQQQGPGGWPTGTTTAASGTSPALAAILPGGGGTAAGAGPLPTTSAASGNAAPPPSTEVVLGRAASGSLPPLPGGGADYSAPVIHTQTPKRPRIYHQENYGTSLVEFLPERLIEVHLSKLRGAGAQVPTRGRVFTLDELPNFEDENSCKVCGLNQLMFEPPSLYCFTCGQRIKRNQTYYVTPATAEVRGFWCHPCYGEVKTEAMPLEGGFSVRRADLEKRRNDEEVEEGWVQCDLCERWVHQVCGLFNKGRNEESRNYHCPQCLLHGLQRGERGVPAERPQAMLAAADLPRCELSDSIEARLARVLAEERGARAAALGLAPGAVPTATGLTVRVVNNVAKRNEVRSRFAEAFRSEGFPEAFVYRQKVILLFQTIDGVDICLYCLYVQEYGDDAPEPNRKAIYLSYLDSVKYLQPEDVSCPSRGGIALRTLVYHEVLLGYLAHAKRRGFLQMFIWACPPLQGDDYILYCHPGRQKTPRSDRLREWYHVMLRAAKSEGIVTHVSNLFDTFFEGGRDHRLERPSVLHLPYFEGDYWPGEAENLLASISEEARQAGKSKTTSSMRSKGMKGKRLGPGDAGLDAVILSRLGETISGMREDFIVAHLAEPCSACRGYISGDLRHAHPAPPARVMVKAERTFDGISLDRPGSEAQRTQTLTRFQLCPACLSAAAAGRGSGPTPTDPGAPRTLPGLPAGIELHDLQALPCPPIPPVTDATPMIESEFFDSRQAFLSLCQGNHYQFDSLRRAKHSSMMVLYHLHNPTAPAFSCTCNICQREIAAGEGYRCTVCTDFDMCNECYRKPTVSHPHALEPHVRKIDETRSRLTEEERQQRAHQLQRTMHMLVHASACNNPNCPSSNCAKIKRLFQHAMSCPKKIHGNCQLCWRMWSLLQVHAKQCVLTGCPVPRCRELRELSRNQAARREEQRRRAYRAMLVNQSSTPVAA